jgi:ATP-dependent Lhr-like helicase
VLDGRHALLGAPTAGGKTEAVVLPLLSRMTQEHGPVFGVLSSVGGDAGVTSLA